MSHTRSLLAALALSVLWCSGPVQAETARPDEDDIRTAARSFADTLPAGTCPTGVKNTVRLEAGKSYFGCDITATALLLEGTGPTSLADSTLHVTLFQTTATGTLDLSVARIAATGVKFKGSGEVNLQGARLNVTGVCGNLERADLSGSTISATGISLNMKNAKLQYATMHATSFGPGSIEGARLFETDVSCNLTRTDLTKGIGPVTGGCRLLQPISTKPIC